MGAEFDVSSAIFNLQAIESYGNLKTAESPGRR